MPGVTVRQRWAIALALSLVPLSGWAGAGQWLPASAFTAGQAAEPVNNLAFVPGADAEPAPALSGVLTLVQSPLKSLPTLVNPVIDGRDARLFPGVSIEFFTLGDRLVPVERGEMVAERPGYATSSYWRIIPGFGRVWHEKADGPWSRAAFPATLVNDTENHAHQGVVTFLYRDGAISSVRLQFVQQTAPYLLKQHFVLWGQVAATWTAGDAGRLSARRAAAEAELADRLPTRPWSELLKEVAPGTLDGFGGPMKPRWQVITALVRHGTLFYGQSATPYGPFPYPLEMRFGVRSVMKSVAAPLSLLHLAEVYGPYVLNLRIGDYVKGVPAKYDRVRFIDAANMASGFGGTGTFRTHPNDIEDGYLDGDYDAWYTAPSNRQKIAQIGKSLKPYPWEPGTVVRYRDQDFYLLGVAIDAFLKSVRGPDADAWSMLESEVLGPIGVHHAPAVRTREDDEHSRGLVWFNAGYYPTLDDLAKIALLYQHHGEHNGKQLLHRQLTDDLLAARDALTKRGDASLGHAVPGAEELYKMGFHFTPYTGSASHRLYYLPTMEGSGGNEVILFPNDLISIRMAKATELPPGERADNDDGPATARAVDRLAPF